MYLDATVSDDGNPDPPGAYTTRWTVTGGPESGYVNIADKYAVDTTAAFSASGVYVLRLAADDTLTQPYLDAPYDEATITVNE